MPSDGKVDTAGETECIYRANKPWRFRHHQQVPSEGFNLEHKRYWNHQLWCSIDLKSSPSYDCNASSQSTDTVPYECMGWSMNNINRASASIWCTCKYQSHNRQLNVIYRHYRLKSFSRKQAVYRPTEPRQCESDDSAAKKIDCSRMIFRETTRERVNLGLSSTLSAAFVGPE